MKYQGEKIQTLGIEVLVIPRQAKKIVIKAQPVLSYDEFDQICKSPVAPMIIKANGEQFTDLNDKQYNGLLELYSKKRMAWMFLKSLQASEDLEFETVDFKNPDTWINYEKEMKEFFSVAEYVMIQRLVLSACGLNMEKIEEATKNFIAGQGKETKSQ